MSQHITNAWQKRSWTLLLLPLSLLFGLLSSLRRLLFKLGLKSSYRPSVPVIVVGNITVGGSGKTPTVLWLVSLLRKAGYQPGVVSRGYGGQAKSYPMVVTPDSLAAESGDEPLLIARRVPVPVVVDPVRTRAAQKLEELGCNVIITDDGLQHYALQRDLELIVVDGKRRFGNGLLLPAGPLREPLSRLRTVEAVICNGRAPHQGEWRMDLVAAHHWRSVYDDALVTQGFFKGKNVLAIAGIGHPQRFFELLTKLGIVAETLPLSDHAQISPELFAQWQQKYDVILMTEKDAVKCKELSEGLCFYLPIEAHLNPDLEDLIITQLKSLPSTS